MHILRDMDYSPYYLKNFYKKKEKKSRRSAHEIPYAYRAEPYAAPPASPKESFTPPAEDWETNETGKDSVYDERRNIALPAPTNDAATAHSPKTTTFTHVPADDRTKRPSAEAREAPPEPPLPPDADGKKDSGDSDAPLCKQKSAKKGKRDFGGIIAVLMIFLCFGIVVCAAPFFTGERILESATFQEHAGEYYYVIGGEFTEKNTAEARARAVALGGGAGYLLYDGKTYFVVLSAYETKSDAEKVAAKNSGTTVLTRKPRTFSDTKFGKDGMKKCNEFVSIVTKILDILQNTILSTAKGETDPDKALRILNSARADLLNEKADLMNTPLSIAVKQEIAALGDPLIGGIEALNAPHTEIRFLAAMRYVYAASSASITE